MKSDFSMATAEGGLPKIAPATRAAIRRHLAGWYAQSRRDLPWRRTRDPYAVWVSEVMLQQTQVKTVLPYYTRFLKRFPDITRLAGTRGQALLKIWEGLGYFSRARNMHRTARIVTEEMQGRLPATWEGLRPLPGIGDYIAAAVLSIAHDAPYAVVDGNVKRVLARLFCVDRPVNQASAHKAFQALADQLLDKTRSGDHNQAVMELGALVCTPRRPACGHCPLARYCRALQADCVNEYPLRIPKRALPTRHWVAGAVIRDGRLLITRRPEEGLLGGLWEFPGGEIRPGDDGARACAGQIKSLVRVNIAVNRKVATIAHTYTHFKLHLDLYLCQWISGTVQLNGPTASKWVRPGQITKLPLHGAMQKALPYIVKALQS